MAGARRNVRSRFSVAKTNDINTPSVARGIGKYEALGLRQRRSQIQIRLTYFDAELADLKCRHMNTGNNSDYLEFKITIIQGVIRMYEEYRETKWTQLQKETALALREVLQREAIVPAMPLTPPLSPSGTPPPSPTHRVPESPRHVNEMEWADDDEFYLIPAPIAPIRDMDFLPTPPSSPSHYSNSLFTDVPDYRDF